jgi:magnesium transporter
MADPQARTTLTMLLGTPVMDASGKLCGKVKDVAVATGAEAGKVAGLVLRNRGGLQVISAIDLRRTPSGALELRPAAVLRPLTQEESFILLRQDLLDRQIIDVHGRKVVRVNDVDLQWVSHEHLHAHPEHQLEQLRVTEVEIGLRGAARRLLLGLMPAETLDRLVRRIPTSAIPWDFVDMIEVDPARRVKLKIEHDRLAQLHPSDIADILEELAPAEREALLTSLDEEVAAEALEEVDPKLQKSLMQSLDTETAAAIVEEMDPSAAADLLADLSEEQSEAILEEMDPEERQEVEELLEFREDSAAGRMTTEYVSVSHEATVADCIEALREFEGDLETITEIYLLDEDRVLQAVVPLARLMLARPETRVRVLSEPRLITCDLDAHQNRVAELFDKYNLRALPVVDKQRRLAGVVEADHVIAFLREKL